MRGGKAEGKIVGPLFPRLHVNDTEKGGPKPPPRNKMALYEQLAIPSQRSTDTPASMLPPRSVYGGTLAKMESSSQGLGLEKATFFPLQSAASYHSDGRQGSCYGDRMSNKTNGRGFRSLMTTQTGNKNAAEKTNPTFMCTSFQPFTSSQFKWPSLKDEAKFKARSLSHSSLNMDSNNNQCRLNKESDFVGSSSSPQLLSAGVKRQKASASADEESEGSLRCLNEEGLEMQDGQGHEKRFCNIPQATQEHTEDVSTEVQPIDKISSAMFLKPSTGEEQHELSKQAPASLDSDHLSSELNEISSSKAREHVYVDSQPTEVPTIDVTEQSKDPDMNGGLVFRTDVSHKSPMTYIHSKPLHAVGNDNRHQGVKESRPVQAYIFNKNEDISNAPLMDSMSAMLIRPDDVVEIIGHRRFWKARRAIIDQQRAFALQIFELHRIIKVQEIIASSRSLIVRERLFQRKPFSKVSSVEELSHNYFSENSLWHMKSRDTIDKIKVPADNPVEKQPRTLKNAMTTVATITGQNCGNLAAALPSSLDNQLPSPMWCLPPLGNQWLVPVMSPSEGLVYKPLAEPPCLPSGGVLANYYGSCWPTNAMMPSGELVNSHCGYLPAPPVVPTYFPPYGMPVVSPSLPASTIGPTAGTTIDSSDFSALYQSSCIVASERNVGEVLVPKDSASVDGVASITKNTSGNALSLFPTAPKDSVAAAQPVQSYKNGHKTQVIRVIPRNPKLARESAARIIQLIQEERKSLCN